MSDDVWMTRQEVADRLRLPKQTLAQWASQGRGPRYARFGRGVRYLLADVRAWEQTQYAAAAD